jgi:hypothetical protein
MSLNTFMNSLDPIKSSETEADIVNYTRMEKLDTFLDSRVINKYKQPWKNLTKFLKRDRIIFYFNENSELLEHLPTVLEQLDNNTLVPKDIKYNDDIGEIETLKT